jgi:hypothetical protein
LAALVATISPNPASLFTVVGLGNEPLIGRAADEAGATLSVAFLPGSVTIVSGTRGNLAPRLSLRPISSANATTLEFELIGDPNTAYTLQASIDLKTWTAATVSQPGAANTRIVLPLENGFSTRFYRAIAVP